MLNLMNNMEYRCSLSSLVMIPNTFRPLGGEAKSFRQILGGETYHLLCSFLFSVLIPILQICPASNLVTEKTSIPQLLLPEPDVQLIQLTHQSNHPIITNPIHSHSQKTIKPTTFFFLANHYHESEINPKPPSANKIRQPCLKIPTR